MMMATTVGQMYSNGKVARLRPCVAFRDGVGHT